MHTIKNGIGNIINEDDPEKLPMILKFLDVIYFQTTYLHAE